ncbi:hypothetical protein PAXRUDRAFT_18156 [Paxillus rubicundulus Ve08.2h10]|uniref:Uncharacterized protein n=1 Tax=Paxillus rubicundulus Ve08.2h10 TaxID=930991 RepID=A0A0D0D863_9AGAM|nr:hypothetical protein PAXRUDRAFT_18156 [Paxillus rubicundulus Ve08.2h10]
MAPLPPAPSPPYPDELTPPPLSTPLEGDNDHAPNMNISPLPLDSFHGPYNVPAGSIIPAPFTFGSGVSVASLVAI